MKLNLKIVLFSLLIALLLPCTLVAQGSQPVTVKQERNHVRVGNRLYQKKRYNEAEVEYRKALEANPRSAMAQFNLASALLREDATSSTKSQQQQASKQHSEAVRLLSNLEKSCSDRDIASRASYDLGNLLYKQQNYQEAIAHYEQALRKNPDYDNARYNLRMAQLKLKQNKNNNKQNKSDKNKDKNKKKDKSKNNNNRNKQNQQNKQTQMNRKQQAGMSSDNMDQILRTMQNQENATRQRVEQRKAQMQAGERARTQNKW